ncbi:MAG TPA: TonB family protein [Acidobacteriota bacterium]|nr:TonB family protein [Acidobacteriota bacterium]
MHVKKWLMRLTTIMLCVLAVSFGVKYSWDVPLSPVVQAQNQEASESGALILLDKDRKPVGQCALKHTAVSASLSGNIGRVTVEQTFINRRSNRLEAVYVFPLPQMAAVDRMTMKIGERVIEGEILSRAEAARLFKQARKNGETAALLDQERPNVFTQSVTNIPPGATVVISISYVETLKYEDGEYEFVFPMTVGERYISGSSPTDSEPKGLAVTVPDAARVTPPLSIRPGHDISLKLQIDAGVPIQSVVSPTHRVLVDQSKTMSTAALHLKTEAEIPNKDFIVRYKVAGPAVSQGVLAHNGPLGGYFTLMVQPPSEIRETDLTPKELVFVLDTSGSMNGFPIEKAKEAMDHALKGLYPQDTFNLITFAGDTHILFQEPVPATPENLTKASTFLKSRSGGGGTEMMKAIRAALEPSDSQNHLRVVCFMTDGYVGDDLEILSEVKKHPNARVFSFGIGSSVNRFLLEEMARLGRGEVEFVGLEDDGSAAAQRFHERVRSPLLTDISIDWNGLPVKEVYPAQIPDLFSATPVVVTGRFEHSARGEVVLRGKVAGRPVEQRIQVELPAAEPQHDELATLWARQQLRELMRENYDGFQQGTVSPELEARITRLGLKYRLVTPFTSFLAIDRGLTQRGKLKKERILAAAPDKGDDGPIGPEGPATGLGGFGDGDGDFGDGAASGAVASPVFAPPREAPKEIVNTPPPAKIIFSDPNVLPMPAPPPPPGRQPAPPSVVRRSEGVMRGNALARVTPEYPKAARSARVAGDVVVELVIDEKGNVESVRVVSGHALLRQAAINAAQQWKFKPTLLNKAPVKVTGILTFRFTL